MTEYRSFDDDVMKELFEQIAQEEIRKFDRGDEVKHRFSLRFRLKKRRLFRKMGLTARPKVRVRLNWRTAVCVIVMISLLTVSVGAAQGWFTRMEVLEQEDTSVTFLVTSESDAERAGEAGVPTELPEGFCIFRHEVIDSGWEERYYKKDGYASILFERKPVPAGHTMKYSFILKEEWQQFEFSEISEIQIGEYQGMMFVAHFLGEIHGQIDWSDGINYYSVMTSIGYDFSEEEYFDRYGVYHPVPNTLDDLILIAESVR